jgi:hypothetical protein
MCISEGRRGRDRGSDGGRRRGMKGKEGGEEEGKVEEVDVQNNR